MIVAVGRVKERPVREILDDYLGRLRRHVACDEVEVADGSTAKVEAALARATAGATVVALEVTGRALTSHELARDVERHGSRGKGVVAFAIGGADGLPRAFSDAANDRLSLSKLTLPHRLARVVLAEQLYRAMTILRGEPYSH
jgi:23S rRNA (pseudouridine1915-N3)-methyltransferase